MPPSAHPRGGEGCQVAEEERKRRGRQWLPLVALAAAGWSLAACSGGVPPGGPSAAVSTTRTTDSTTPSTSTSTTVSALAQARQFTACMRSHGVTDFPELTDNNGQISFSGGPPGLGRTPDFQSAQQTCSEAIYHTAPTGGNNAG